MTHGKVMFVEGTDDKHVVMHICGNHGIPDLDKIEPVGGDDQLLKRIPVELKSASEEGDVIGVVIDADQNVSGRWQSLREKLRCVGYMDVPDEPGPGGTILLPPTAEPLLPRTGVWIMPDNRTEGILEDFLRFLVPRGDSLLAYADSCVDSIPEQRFSENDRIKAVMHTWLAWQSEPGKPYGQAITAKFLDPQSDHAKDFATWIRRLFFG